MSSGLEMCTVDDELKKTLRKFRFRKAKNSAAIIMKVDIKQMTVMVEDEMEDCDMEEVAGELPEFSPRYVAYSYQYTHSDGRISYPLVFIYYCPGGVKPEHNMIYASTKPAVVKALEITKVFEVRDSEDMTDEWINKKMGFFN